MRTLLNRQNCGLWKAITLFLSIRVPSCCSFARRAALISRAPELFPWNPPTVKDLKSLVRLLSIVDMFPSSSEGSKSSCAVWFFGLQGELEAPINTWTAVLGGGSVVAKADGSEGSSSPRTPFCVQFSRVRRNPTSCVKSSFGCS